MRCVPGRYEHRQYHGDEIAAVHANLARELHPRLHPEFADKAIWIRAIGVRIRELKYSIKAEQRLGRCVLVATGQLRSLRWAAWVLNTNRRNGWTNSLHRHLPEDVQLHDGMLLGPGLPHYCPVELMESAV